MWPGADESILFGHTEHSETVALVYLLTFNRHLGILGADGSGRTTLAFRNVLLRGFPVILIVWKGDLAGYASNNAW